MLRGPFQGLCFPGSETISPSLAKRAYRLDRPNVQRGLLITKGGMIPLRPSLATLLPYDALYSYCPCDAGAGVLYVLSTVVRH